MCVCCDVALMTSSPAGHKHLQLSQVHMGPVSFHLLPGSPAACQRCPPHGRMMAVAVPTISFPSAASQAGRKGRHFLLMGLFFYQDVPRGLLLTSHWSLLGHMPGCKGVWESNPIWQLRPFVGGRFCRQARRGGVGVGN